VFVHDKPLQLSLMFATNARTYMSQAPFRSTTLG
jgi:hypothetical protein